MASLQQIFGWFSRGLFPTQDQYKQTFSSFWHRSERLPQSQVLGLNDALANKVDRDELINMGVGIKGYGDDVQNIADLQSVPNKYAGLAVLVINDKDENGNSYVWLYDGTKWGRTPYTSFPKDVITQSKLTKVLGDSDVKAPSEKAVDKSQERLTVTVKNADLITRGGKFLFCSDGKVDIMATTKTDESIVSIREFIGSNGEFVNEVTAYYRSGFEVIPNGANKVKIKSFSISTRARAIAFYDDNQNTIYVPVNVGEGIETVVDIPLIATKYVVSKNTNFAPFVCEFYNQTGSVDNDNTISLLEVENGTAKKTVLQNLSNLDYATPLTNPSLSKNYVVDKGAYPFFSSRVDSIDISLVNIDGFINRTDGTVQTWNTSYAHSDFLEITDPGSLTIALGVSHNSQIACDVAFYDENKVFISANSVGETGMSVPENAKYYRLCRFKTNEGYSASLVYDKYNHSMQDLTTPAYINRTTGTSVASNLGYFHSDYFPIDPVVFAYVFVTVSHGSPGACDIAFFDENKKFISANAQGVLFMLVPPNAKYYILCSNLRLQGDYKAGEIQRDQIKTISNLSLLRSNHGAWEVIDLAKEIEETRRNNIIKSLVDKSLTITATNQTAAKQLIYNVDTYLEKIAMSTSFEVLTDDAISVWTGKSHIGIKLKSDKIETYKINGSLNGTTLNETFDLPFEVKKGERYTIGFEKDTDTVKFFIRSNTGSFEKTYNKLTDSLQSIMWGVPFFGVENGSVKVFNSTISSPYYPDAVLVIWGDSFIEGATMVQYGLDKRWVAKLAARIGELRTVIIGKGGEAVGSAFFARFIIENAWFKPKYAIISLGTNNYGNIDNYKTWMQRCIDHLKENGQIPVLVTCTPRPRYDYNTTVKVINDWVKASGELYIDMHKAMTKPNAPDQWGDGLVLADLVHPSVAGHDKGDKQIGIDCPQLYQL